MPARSTLSHGISYSNIIGEPNNIKVRSLTRRTTIHVIQAVKKEYHETDCCKHLVLQSLNMVRMKSQKPFTEAAEKNVSATGDKCHIYCRLVLCMYFSMGLKEHSQVTRINDPILIEIRQSQWSAQMLQGSKYGRLFCTIRNLVKPLYLLCLDNFTLLIK
ncbi:hypothetical protein BDV38DRAFT_39421 [Aspergillus pseudotamarii]|uniref:Uncharacterized protein n=1 Tax=Aspergillus pseudotamarii TaxID=132259 RepID=A0A5N6S8G6_ASPPS|nr:uncharacterized protein BDV38DRAFT_39421 [Aspergillus pseudotamarii]KAE8130875.1 hypothetical protein BDV38DRAFT_39421 [Aspergillus pseudotamarii]